jgi:hypothetical protein
VTANRVIPALLLSTALARTAAADPPRVEISWDPDLAFEHDRENYQRSLSAIVDGAYQQASADTGFTLRRVLRVSVHSRAGYESAFGSGAAWNRDASRLGGTQVDSKCSVGCLAGGWHG